eukprot:scaffold4840_cov115-Isochrysis_galbana.AAC.3
MMLPGAGRGASRVDTSANLEPAFDADVIARYRSWPAARYKGVQSWRQRPIEPGRRGNFNAAVRPHTSVPDLRLDDLAIMLDTPGCKLNANGGLGVEVELVPGKPTQQVGLAHARIADDDH